MQSAALAMIVALGAVNAWAQAPGTGTLSAAPRDSGDEPAASMTTRAGHEVTVGIGSYTYVEPGDLRISISGPKLIVQYTGTLSLNQRTRWFMEAGLRLIAGRVSYDGWCLPWLIRPDARSANGYSLGLGNASACSFSGDADGYVEVRGLVGKDFRSSRWGVAPVSGVGVRYLSNGATGVAGFRTDTYVYVPFGVTARTGLGSGRRVSANAEYDILLRGWQTTRESQLGGGVVEATPTAPAFTIDRFTDLSFPQHRGWALRAGAKYEFNRHWSIAPAFIHWKVSESDVHFTTVTFTVNGITATQDLGAIEPVNSTDEWSVNVGFHF